MKKMFKRVISIICTAVLLSVPTTASAASTTNVQENVANVQAASSWQCIADYSSGTMIYKEFAYTPAQIVFVATQSGFYVPIVESLSSPIGVDGYIVYVE